MTLISINQIVIKRVWIGLLLTGCSLKSEYQRPAIPVPQNYPAETISHGISKDSDSNTYLWEDFFVDEQLRSLIKKALEYNRNLRIMAQRIKELRIAYGIRRTEAYPQLTLGGVVPRFDLPADISPSRSDQPTSLYVAGITGAWELDFWGRIQNLSEAALMEYLASDSAWQAASLSLIVNIADAYISSRELVEQIQIADQAIATRKKTFDMFNRRYQVGSATKFELSQSETLLTQAQSLSAQLRQSRAIYLHALSALVGDVEPLNIIETQFNDEYMMKDFNAGLPSDLLTNRPDIMEAEYKLKAAHANVAAARAAFLPRITLNASYGGISSELNGLFDPANRAWLFVPNISVPIFDGGRTQSNFDIAEVRKNIAIAYYEKSIQQAFREVSDNLTSKQSLQEQLQIQHRAVAAQKERLRLARLRYDRGSSTFFEVLDAERDWLTVQQQLTQLRRNLLTTQVSLYAALGGGSLQPLVTDDAH